MTGLLAVQKVERAGGGLSKAVHRVLMGVVRRRGGHGDGHAACDGRRGGDMPYEALEERKLETGPAVSSSGRRQGLEAASQLGYIGFKPRKHLSSAFSSTESTGLYVPVQSLHSPSSVPSNPSPNVPESSPRPRRTCSLHSIPCDAITPNCVIFRRQKRMREGRVEARACFHQYMTTLLSF